MNFNELSIDQKILDGINDAQFTECTEVQAKSYPHSLKGEDLLVQSQTGSGKTAAFLIPTFQALLDKGGKALIISPTRELAIQIEEECEKLGGHTGLTFGAFYGGTGYDKQEKLLEKGVDICIGTPGRLLDFNKSHKLNFANFSIIVIDEADRLFDMGFYPDIQYIMKRAKKPVERQTMLFSATLSLRVRQLAWAFMDQPVEIEIKHQSLAVDNIEQSLYHVSTDEKMALLLGILKREKPSAVLIFTNTKNQAAIVSQKLNYNGYKSLFISGDLPQNKRLAAINQIKEGKLQILTATDVAARGLDIEDLPLVINYDLPEDAEVYVHRIGRTARAGKTGKAISFACEKYVFHLEDIEALIKQKIPVEYVEDDLLEKDLSIGQPIHLPREERSDRHHENRSGNRPNNQKNHSSQYHSNNKKFNSNRPNSKPLNKNRGALPKRISNASEAERRAYYQAKYGENFGAPITPIKQKQIPKQTKTQNINKKTKAAPIQPPKKLGFFARLFKRHNQK